MIRRCVHCGHPIEPSDRPGAWLHHPDGAAPVVMFCANVVGEEWRKNVPEPTQAEPEYFQVSLV